MKGPKPFEEKACIQCGTPYKHYPATKHNLCRGCRDKHFNKKQALKPEERKKPYPLNSAQKRSRYNRIKKELDNAWTRDEWREIFRKNLEEVIQTGIWEWCIDLRQTPEPKGYGRAGRQPKIENQYPDTRHAEL